MTELLYHVKTSLPALASDHEYSEDRIKQAISEHVEQLATRRYKTAGIAGVLGVVMVVLLCALLKNEAAPWAIATVGALGFFSIWLTHKSITDARAAKAMPLDRAFQLYLAGGLVAPVDTKQALLSEFDKVKQRLDSGSATREQLEREYAARWDYNPESAKAVVDGAALIRTMSEMKDGHDTLEMIDRALGIEPVRESSAAPTTASEYRIPPGLHDAESLSRRDRRALYFLAHRVKQALARKTPSERLASAIQSLGVAGGRADEFVSIAQKAMSCIESGPDLSALSTQTLGIRNEETGEVVTGGVALEMLRTDSRPMSLYLRSHSEDSAVVQSAGLAYRLLGGKSPQTFEQIVFPVYFRHNGPLYALRGPDDHDLACVIPRLNVEKADWKNVVTFLLLTADTVLLRFRDTAGLAWEARRALAVVRAERLIIAFPEASSLPGREQEWRDHASPLLKHGEGFLDIPSCRDALSKCPLFLRFAADGTALPMDRRSILGSPFRIQAALEQALKSSNEQLGLDDVVDA